jgi:D-alanyl-D-alanine carboxypeptidase (penicillin-binding protein 5/6)
VPPRRRVRPTRATYLRRRIAVFGGLGALLVAATYLPMTLLAPLPPASATAVTTALPENPAVELPWPGYGASAIGAVGFTGVLASGGSDKPRTIASISKIVTSLVVLEKKPLAADSDGPTITMTSADVVYYHDYLARRGEVRPVRAGLRLTERQLLQVVLIASANNYAETMAIWAFGSEKAFLAAAATWLDAHGLHDTTLREPTGMDPGNTSTSSDLVALGELALADPVVSSIVRMKSVVLPYIGTVENTNKLLGTAGVDGIKTGTLDEAGACLLFSAAITVGEHPITLVGVVLGGPDHPAVDAAVRKLLSAATAGFRELPLVTAGEVFYSYSTPWEQSAHAVAARDASALVWAGAPVTRSVHASDLRDGSAGDEVGTVTVTVGDAVVSVPLELDSAVADPGPWWRLTHPFG